MSKTTTFRPGSCFWRFVAVVLIFLLNPCTSVLILATHPFPWNPNKVINAGRQPIGGSEVTPSFLAPRPQRSCFQSERRTLYSTLKSRQMQQLKQVTAFNYFFTSVRLNLKFQFNDDVRTFTKFENSPIRKEEYSSGVQTLLIERLTQ